MWTCLEEERWSGPHGNAWVGICGGGGRGERCGEGRNSVFAFLETSSLVWMVIMMFSFFPRRDIAAEMQTRWVVSFPALRAASIGSVTRLAGGK